MIHALSLNPAHGFIWEEKMEIYPIIEGKVIPTGWDNEDIGDA